MAVDGLLEPEAGNILLAALEPLARPHDAQDTRNGGGQRTADALAELARRAALEAGWLPKTGGVRPQLLVTVDLDSLLGHPGGVGGEVGWAGPLAPQACRRLACDGAVTRVLVTRHPSDQHPGGHADHGSAANHDPSANDDHSSTVDHDPGAEERPGTGDPTGGVEALQERLRAAMALLPPVLGGAPLRPLDVGWTTRVVRPAQRSALAVGGRRLCRPRLCSAPGLV